MLEKTPKINLVTERLTPIVLKAAVRDAILVAAVDGEYDSEEIKIIKQIAKAAGVKKVQLSALFEWVKEGWEWHKQSFEHLKLV